MAMLRLGFSCAVGAISSARSRCLWTTKAALTTVSDRHFSTGSSKTITRKVVKSINSEIIATELALTENIKRAQANLPFTIEDDPKYCHIMLKRVIDKEKIDVTVNPVHDISSEDEDKDESSSTESDSDDNSEELSGVPPQSVAINVSISKENKGTLDVGAHVSADKIVVHRMSFTEPDQCHSSLRYYVEAEGELQDGLRKYVKERGIETEKVGFLYNYMVEKRKQWGTVWTPGRKPTAEDLKNLKKVFEDW